MIEYYFGTRRNISASEYDNRTLMFIIHVPPPPAQFSILVTDTTSVVMLVMKNNRGIQHTLRVYPL